MPIALTQISALRRYLDAVLERAGHHAGEVDEIVFTLCGTVIWRAEGDLQVRAQDGEMKNALWIRIDGQRYALSYNHTNRCIDVRDGTLKGTTLASFTNANTAREVREFFASL